MVHLSPDSRLLVSLVKQEQAYASQLHSLLNASGTSLSALAAYASSAPPTISPVLNGVASALSGADGALLNYGEALNNWIDELGTIKSKEEEVANIGRDREILVTRLLKLSQKSKSPPPSLHVAPDSSSNVSFPTFGSKVSTAQTELQACESYLAERERQLERHRIHAIRHGLKLRCEALVQCGWMWGEMGRRALSMIENLKDVPLPTNGHASNSYKLLPHPNADHDRDSILSSLTPSQSASQIGAMTQPGSLSSYEKPYRLDIPPLHQMLEHPTIPHPSREPNESNSSSEDEGPVEVHENPLFQPASIISRQGTVKTAPSSPVRSSPVPFPSQSVNSDFGPSITSTRSKYGRDRKSTGIFGSIALLFRTSMNNKSSSSLSGTKWSSRTDNNIRSVKTDGENSTDEEVPRVGRLRKAKARSAPRRDVKQNNAMLTSSGTSPLSVSSPSTPSARIKHEASGEKLKSATMAIEPASAPRSRANTLTHSSSGGVMVDAKDPVSRGHGRRASLDGRWGLTDPGTMASPHSASLSSIRKPPKPSMASKPGSLMSIVEGVSHSAQHDDPSSKLEVVRAPGNAFAGLPLLVHHPPPATNPAPPLMETSISQKRLSLPSLSASSSSARNLLSVEKKPLRSAMRNPNRDRSISPPPPASPTGNFAQTGPNSSSTISPLSLPEPVSPSPNLMSISRPEISSTVIESPRHSSMNPTQPETSPHHHSSISAKTDDSASISSYETGHEDFDDESPEPTTLSVALIIPSADGKTEWQSSVPNVSPPNGTSDGLTSDRHELSSATSTDTAAGATPTRRKSVRMSSLPPQFSATPPALDDDEDRSPWGRSSPKALGHDEGWKTRIPSGNLAWDDSSSEDETYKNARKALSRADRRLEKQSAVKSK